ncbi:DUF4837 family protein [Flavobacterium sp. CYK-55]|uniref:DUF4837 family protein n=1 Tax=Flavobacterium sp. CYK-55 TaxID=2835529 RepID=UPI001BCC7A9E|nr:DUF4837 family protein [Flavobacterium sp. CYK-55]MBS7786135.1 DUF4837 family protein [Flavobacterium sp. CYK-55]
MKKALFFVIIFLAFATACMKKPDRTHQKTSGPINTISVIIDDPLWNGEVGDSIRNKFAGPVIGLPQEEPMFTINQYPLKLLEGFTTNSRNIIIIKKETETKFEIVQNEFAHPQNVIHISAKTTALLLEQIEQHAPEIIRRMHNTEIFENQRIIDTAKILTKKIQRKFGIDIHIPQGFKYVLQRRKFVWLKKEITSGNASILIYQIPMSNLFTSRNITKSIIKTRDSIGSLYIRGMGTNSPMITENSYAPYLFRTRIAGRETYETKGTWELRNDYMSGPFINYHLIDRSRKRILVIEGFCYDPSEAKRDIMFELEAIIKSVEFLKKTNRK